VILLAWSAKLKWIDDNFKKLAPNDVKTSCLFAIVKFEDFFICKDDLLDDYDNELNQVGHFDDNGYY
jgi:hypothetical protein